MYQIPLSFLECVRPWYFAFEIYWPSYMVIYSDPQKAIILKKIMFLLQNDRFMEITEAFHPQTPIGSPIGTPMGVNNLDPDPIGGRGLLHEGRGNPPKRSPNCNGHPASSSIQVYRDGEISFIPLQERGIILHGKPEFIWLHITSDL